MDYGKSHPKENSHNGYPREDFIGDTAFYVSRMGYPRFCDTKSMCLNVGAFAMHDLSGRKFPIGEAMSNHEQHKGMRTPEITPDGHGTKKYGMTAAFADVTSTRCRFCTIIDWKTNKPVSLGYP